MWLISISAAASLLLSCQGGSRPVASEDLARPTRAVVKVQALGGWLGPEVIRGAPARWLSQTAEVSLEVPAAARYRLSFWLDPFIGLRTVRLEYKAHVADFKVSAPALVGTVLDLPAGKSIVKLTAVEECVRPIDALPGKSQDKRCLSVMFRGLMLTKEEPLSF